MSDEPDFDIQQFIDNPGLFGQVLERILESIELPGNPDEVKASEIQLQEIAKTIESLSKKGVSVPEPLRAEKVRLATELEMMKTQQSKLFSLLTEIEGVYKKLSDKLNYHPFYLTRKARKDRPDHERPCGERTGKRQESYTHTLPRSLTLFERTYSVNTWRDVKAIVYNTLMQSHPSLTFGGTVRRSQNVHDFRDPIHLDNGWYTEGSLSANRIVDHCRQVLESVGSNPDHCFHVEVEKKIYAK